MSDAAEQLREMLERLELSRKGAAILNDTYFLAQSASWGITEVEVSNIPNDAWTTLCRTTAQLEEYATTV
jgi:hypothetical protein